MLTRWLHRIRSIFRLLFFREGTEQLLNEDADSWMELLAEEKMREGLPAAEARRAAQMELGGVEQLKIQVRESRNGAMLDTLRHDVHFGFKLLWRDRGFALTAILTVAICIAANTTIFTVVNSVLLKPLPIPDSRRLLLMSNQYPNMSTGDSHSSGAPDYYDRLKYTNVFEDQAVFDFLSWTVPVDHVPLRLPGMEVTPSFFKVLKVPPFLGRTFSEDEGLPENQTKTIVLSYNFWKQDFGSDPNIVGKQMQLGALPTQIRTVIGVMPRDFDFMDPSILFWTPLGFGPESQSDAARYGNFWDLYNIGRLKENATIEQARAEIGALNASNMERLPQWKQLLTSAGFYTRVEPLQDMMVRSAESVLYLLWAGAVLVLMVGIVNIGNLTLARCTFRLKEVATRLAVGASYARIARQFLTECVMVTLCGGIGGLILGAIALRLLASFGLERLPRATEIHMDGSVVIFSIVIAIATGIAIGLFGLVRFLRLDVNKTLHTQGRTSTSGREIKWLRNGMVMAQFALAMILLAGAGLLAVSYRQLVAADPGFRTEGVLTAATNLPTPWRYPTPETKREFMDRTLEAIRHISGVVAAGATTNLPLSGNNSDSVILNGKQDNVILAEGYVPGDGESVKAPLQIGVTPGYLEAMGIELVRGRYFNDFDGPSSTPAVIIDESLARRFWNDRDPIGQRMYQPGNPKDLSQVDDHTRWFTVVGVVRSVKMDDLASPSNQAGAFYFPFAQAPFRFIRFAIKTSGDPRAAAKSAREALSEIDPVLAFFDVRTMFQLTDRALLLRKATLTLAIAFSVVALFLSALGVYGVLDYLVSQREREFGIRLSLGCSTQQLFKLLLKEGMLLVGIGLAIGMIGVVAVRRVIQSQLYGMRSADPIVIGIIVLVLGGIAAIACVLPARRACKVDPVIVLNQE